MPRHSSLLRATVRYATEAVAAAGARFQVGARDTVEVLRHNMSGYGATVVGYNTSASGGGGAVKAGEEEDGSGDGGMPLVRQPMVMIVLLSVAYSLVFLLAIVNNGLVVAVIYRTPQMRNVTNYFLANLAVADITVSFIVLPITLLSNIFTGKWHFI